MLDHSKLQPVEGKQGWYRDPESNAVINTNKNEYDKYMTSYNKRKRRETTVEALQNEVETVKSDLSEIKDLLKTLLEKNQ